MAERSDYPQWVVDLAMRFAEMNEGPEAGWGIYAELVWAHVPLYIKTEWYSRKSSRARVERHI